MRGEQDIDPVPDVRPFGVMIVLFGQQGHSRHEPECRREIGKEKAPGYGIACIVEIPIPKRVERGCAFIFVKLFDQRLCLLPIRLYVAGMMGQGQLSFDGVSCRRGGRMLFEHLSFSLGPGDAAIVSGPNGIGKSSLLRLAAGLLPCAGGAIRRAGRIALADESLALDRQLPLAEALRFWAVIDGGAVDEALTALSLGHLAQVPVRMLSTGQRKRATLARVVASRAEIWLLDEPGNGLDTASLEALSHAIAAHRASGGTILAASHQLLGIDRAQDIRLEAAR